MDRSTRLEMLCAIIECFEQVLNDHNIVIENYEKEESGDYDGCSNIYGSDYGYLETAIESTLIGYGLLNEE